MTEQHKKCGGIRDNIFEHFLLKEYKINIVKSFSSDISETKKINYICKEQHFYLLSYQFRSISKLVILKNIYLQY